jgi:hypothetical protein
VRSFLVSRSPANGSTPGASPGSHGAAHLEFGVELGQLGLDVQHPLASGDQLLGQQVPQPDAAPAAQVRSGQARAHASSCTAWSGQARIPHPASGTSPASIATAVCEPLCGSIPIITAVIGTLLRVIHRGNGDRGGHP